MLKQKCDCLNDCGDDSDLAKGLVEACDWRKAAEQKQKDELQAKALLLQNARRYQILRDAHLRALGAIVVQNETSPQLSETALDEALDKILNMQKVY